MPREGYITRQDLRQYEVQKTQLEQEQELNVQDRQFRQFKGEEWDAFHKMQEDTEHLTSNKRTAYFSSKEKKDSEMMRDVKEALQDVTNFYLETSMAATQEEFEEQLTTLRGHYENLKNMCSTYLREKKGGWKKVYHGEGYRRYQLVKNAQAKASAELALLESRAKQVFEAFADVEEEDERPLWVNVLAEARTRKLDLSREDSGRIEYCGGNTSNVLKLTAPNGEIAYIKKNEKNVPVERKARNFIVNYMDTNSAKAMLSDGMTEQEIQGMLSFLNHCFSDIRSIRWNFMESNKIYATHFEEGRVTAEIFRRVLNEAKVPIPDGLERIFRTRHADQLIKEFGAYFYRNNMSYGIATQMVKIDENSIITDRNVATYRLAELLGLTDLVPATTKVAYTDQDGKEQRGILMAEAKGKELWEANEQVKNSRKGLRPDRAYFDKRLVFQMNSLQVMDIIAGQVDRHNGNMMLEYDGERIIKLKGIDNDLCFGKMTYKEILKHQDPEDNIKPLEDKDGIKLKFIDKKVYDNVLALNDEIIRYTFADLLTKDEMKGLLDRLHGVQKLFRSIKPNTPIKICTEEEFTLDNAVRAQRYQVNCYTSLLD